MLFIEKKAVSGILLTLLLTSMLTLAFHIQTGKAEPGTIYIRADGSIDPPTAPIYTADNITYTLTGNITAYIDGIMIERNNIVIDGNGYTLQGNGNGTGFCWSGRDNVTVQSTNIKYFNDGIGLDSSSSNSFNGNNITNNKCGILLNSSSGNSFSGNNIRDNGGYLNGAYGIYLDSSSSNSFSGNDIENNSEHVIHLDSSSGNSFSGNDIKDNEYGIVLDSSSGNSFSGNDITNYLYCFWLDSSNGNSINGNNITAYFTNEHFAIVLQASFGNNISGNNVTNSGYSVVSYYSFNNRIYHNNFVDNPYGIGSYFNSINIWDNGYPSGGNYWSFYSGNDTKSGPNQDQPGSDGIGDTPYTIDSNNLDYYPLMQPWVSYEGETIYIRADGCIDPPTAPIYTADNITYTLTGDITADADGIVVERNNIVLDGADFTLQGTGSANGAVLSGRSNVTIRNLTVKHFDFSIVVSYSTDIRVDKNKVETCDKGIWLQNSNDNVISGNTLTTNYRYGIWLDDSNENLICGNSAMANTMYGVGIEHSSGTNVTENTIAENGKGIWVAGASYSRIVHNNLIGNTISAQLMADGGTTSWNDSYPSGGNYWSDYTGTDLKSGPKQDEPGSDGIGDTSYFIDSNNKDNYPLMAPFDIVQPHVPMSDPSVTTLPFRLSLNPVGVGWGPGQYDVSLSTSIGYALDFTGDIASLLGMQHVDQVVKIWHIVLADKNGDGKLDFDEVVAMLEDDLHDDVRDKMFWTLLEYGYEMALSAASQYSDVLLTGIVPSFLEAAFLVGGGVKVYGIAGRLIPYALNVPIGPPIIIISDSRFYGLFGLLSNDWSLERLSSNGNSAFMTACPVDLTITNEAGQVVNETISQIPNATCVQRDFDGDGSNDTLITLPEGNHTYSISVIPEPGANPNDTFSLKMLNGGVGLTLENNVSIADAPNATYAFDSAMKLTLPDLKALSVIPMKTVVGESMMLDLNMSLLNQGDYEELTNVTVYANSTLINVESNVTLIPGLPFHALVQWNTTGFSHGNYTVSISIQPIPGEINVSDNNFTGCWVIVSMVGDLTGGTPNPWDFVPDGKCDGKDITIVALCYGSAPGCSPPYLWNPNSDVNNDGKIDGKDIATVALHFGEADFP
jgi:parallel beta-helix repeat protein